MAMLLGMRNDSTPPAVPTVRPHQAIHPDELWTVEEVARFLRVSRSWVYKASSRGDLPCIRIGPMVRFSPAAIRELTSPPPANSADGPGR
jgi:excisionase family DNA binding protein